VKTEREVRRLTQRGVQALQAKVKTYSVWDNEVRGFGIKIHPDLRGDGTCSKTFVVRYQINGNRREKTLGRHGAITVPEAKDLARLAIASASLGDDPLTKPDAPAPRTATILDRYRDAHLSRLRRGDDAYRCLKRNLGKLIDRPIDEITDNDLGHILERRVKDAPYDANRFLSYAKRFFRWCASPPQRYCPNNPTKELDKPHSEDARDRVLSIAEVAALWGASSTLSDPWKGLFRVLLLTGQRHSEVAHMRRDEIDLDDLVWTLPASRTKNRQSHVVHLSKTAADIIQRSMGHRRSEFVFTTSETKPVYAFSAKVKKKLDARSGVSDWRLHDLRRTFASGLAEHGVDIMVADKILNHKAAATMGGVLGVYQRAQLLEPRRQAMDLWAKVVLASTDCELTLTEGGKDG